MSFTPKMIQGPPVTLNRAAIERKSQLWAAQANNWKRLDRIYTNEAQVISLADVLVTTEYFSSDTRLHPSIPEFTVISDDPQIDSNIHVCYRKSLLEEGDIHQDEFGSVTR